MINEKIYKLSVEEVLSECKSNIKGLQETEAENRLIENGLNKLKDGKRKTLIGRFIDQMKNIMIIVLLIASLISFVVSKIEGESITESVIIFAIVILNAFLGMIQESKAEKAIESLKKMSLPYIKVRRGGKTESIKTEELVIGDIVLLEAGDFVPADMRVIESNSLRVEEASLTGESLPVSKFVDTINEDRPLAERRNMMYSGSSVVYGRGEGVVTATGMDTELGKIATILTETKESLTPLQHKMVEISKMLSVVVVIIGLSIVILGFFQGQPLVEIFMLAVSLAVAAIPEGLPASITIILSISVQKMAKENSIIRKLSSVETLGATEVICSDKTGTLTQNKMKVTEININNKAVKISDIDERILDDISFKKLNNIMVLCNDTKINVEGGEIQFLGDPTEVALISLAKDLDIDVEIYDTKYKRVGELPFDSNRKMMTTINKEDEKYFVYTKGATEEVIKRCSTALVEGKIVKMTKELREKISNENKGMSENALRVLGFAYKEVKDIPSQITSEVVETELTYVGLVGMMDPPRPEVQQAVKECFSAGMIPVMITGDNKDTAVAIAKEVGILKSNHQAITGTELDALTDEEFEKRINNIRVYARVSPENKVRIVKMWKKLGKTVAMTGDGVNDAPALKTADIGVGMGITGTEVSKNVASMILTDDNFASIVVAVKEGRRVYKNIQNVITYLLASNIAEVIIVFIAMLFKSTVFLPIQLLWINLISDAIPAMTLGFEPVEKNVMKEKPRSAKEKFFNSFLVNRIVIFAVIKSIIVLVLYFGVKNLYNDAFATTVAFITLSFAELFFSFTIRSDKRPLVSIGFFSNPQLVIGVGIIMLIQGAVIFNSKMLSILGIERITSNLYIVSIGSAIAFALIAEMVKIILAKAFDKKLKENVKYT